MKIVICGGGIIGCSVAYYLAKKGFKSTIVEPVGIACAASGKAGGFLARDWSDGSPLGALSQLSFKMHMELAKEFPYCDYRRLQTLAVTVKEGHASNKRGPVPAWLDGEVDQASVMASPDDTAQVHPYKLCHSFFEKAKELAGTDLVQAKVTGLRKENGKVIGVELSNGSSLDADIVVLAMGPWSVEASKWISIPEVHTWKAASVVFKPETPVTAQALFVHYVPKSGKQQETEWYPRPDDTVYTCSGDEPTNAQLPNSATDVVPSQATVDRIKRTVSKMSSVVGTAPIIKEQACFLPGTSDGVPCIGKVPDTQGVYLATGHGVWGILNSPATGAALAELIIDGKCTLLDLSDFDPARLL